MSLVLGQSINVGFNVSISYPFTYAFPGEILYTAKSSEGDPPWGVNCPAWKIPLFPILSSKELKRVMSNGFIS